MEIFEIQNQLKTSGGESVRIMINQTTLRQTLHYKKNSVYRSFQNFTYFSITDLLSQTVFIWFPSLSLQKWFKRYFKLPKTSVEVKMHHVHEVHNFHFCG